MPTPAAAIFAMTNLVLLSYGSEKEYRRAVLAVLSFFSYYESPPAVRVLVYTDSAHYFSQYLEGLPVEYIILTPAQQTAMMGTVGYRHRIKAVVVGETLARFPQDNLLFFDSDTFFTQHPGPLLGGIRPGVNFMHTVEFKFAENAHVALPDNKTVGDFIKVLEGHPFQFGEKTEQYSGAQQCWNSGLLGLAPTVGAYMPDVMHVIDFLYAQSHWHIIEQIAFSLVLQTREEIKPAEAYLYHYWEGDKKIAADALLAPVLTPTFRTKGAAEQKAIVQRLVQTLPESILAYLAAHPEIGWKQEAITAFNANKYGAGYRAAFAYLRKSPRDQKFIKDIMYHTLRRFRAKG